MRIASFNINNFNRRLPNLLAWLRETEPDVVSLLAMSRLPSSPAFGAERHIALHFLSEPPVALAPPLRQSGSCSPDPPRLLYHRGAC
jgi:hypothetical protein